jgi:multidrug efflux pump subunit AcrA (membrane-fusion protein)
MLHRRPSLFFAAVLLTGISAGCRHEQPYQKPATPVSVQAVQEYFGGPEVRYSGTVEPKSHVDVAFKVSGYVASVATVRDPSGGSRNIQEGDHVSQAAELARVSDTDYSAKVNEARAQVAQAQAALDQVRSQTKEAQVATEQTHLDFTRASNLIEDHSITKPEYDGAKAKFDAAQARELASIAQQRAATARMQAAQAQLVEAQNAVRDCILRSPMNGVVLKRAVEVGSLVGPGSLGLVLADTSSVDVVFGAPDILLPNLRVGAPLRVTTDAIAGDFLGHITRISPAADARSHVFDIQVTIPNPDNRLKAGMVASVEIPSAKPRTPVPVVPLTSIVRSVQHNDGYAVWIVEEQGGKPLARVRDVSLGETYGSLIGISQGVRAGEQVIVSGATLVQNGDPVEIIH